MVTVGRVTVGAGALLALASIFLFNDGAFFLAVVVAVACHELGHYAALRFLKHRIVSLRLDIWGGDMRCDGRLSYSHEIITAAAGPMASFLLAFLASQFGPSCRALFFLSGLSLVYGAFNILPVQALDGGRMIYALTAQQRGLLAAERLTCVLSCGIIGLLLVAGVWLLIRTHVNFTLLLVAVCLLISYCQTGSVQVQSKGKNVGCV
ncbi:hypothetical protein IZU99_06555 [Oscillospiraceae bacterium CM]|nr:hypothetical protein IZU99_06555 [Oscillospiraceae bacterium CM]